MHKKLVAEKVLDEIEEHFLASYSSTYESVASLSLLTIQYYASCHEQNVKTATKLGSDKSVNDILSVLNFYSSAIFSFSQSENTKLMHTEATVSTEITEETDRSLYRIGGGTLAGIYNTASQQKRWKGKLWKSNKKHLSHPYCKIVNVIKMTHEEKSQLPPALSFRDRGGMIFPKQVFLPFIRRVVNRTCTYTNVSAMKKYSSRLLHVSSQHYILCIRSSYLLLIALSSVLT